MSKYSCVLHQEMCKYLELLEAAGRYTSHVKSLFKRLDAVLPDEKAPKGISTANILKLDTHLDCSVATRKKNYSVLRGFMKYLESCGIPCDIPDMPRKRHTNYTPYIFDEDEWCKIMTETDNIASSLKRTGTDMPIMFPMLIRILYSCGLRLSEAINLKTRDVDFNTGCLIIRKTKRKKQRIVPMKTSTIEVMKNFFMRLGLSDDVDVYIFAGANGKPYSDSWVQRWFAIVIGRAGISFERTCLNERGICPHCIRHTFTFRSFQKSGKPFEEMVPFLSTYLGHENIMETDYYLRFSYELYEDAHDIVTEYTTGIFPEVAE